MTTTAPSTDCPPLVFTPPPDYVPGAWFDQAAVDRVVRALRNLKHTTGRGWQGVALEPDPWQLKWIIEPVFGWKHPDGTRIIRTVWVEVPRKNGKSTLSSGLGLVLLCADGEAGAEVYAAAASRDQANRVFGDARKMALASPALKKAGLKTLANLLRYPRNGGIFKALSKIAETAHGLNVSGAVIDEIHVHKSRHLIDAIETGTGSREQPLVIFLTTADEGDDFSIYGEKHEYTRKCAAGIVTDPSHYGVIWAAEETDDPFAEETWRKANPGYGVTIKAEYLRKEANKARSTPSYYPTFCRLHLNRRIRQTSRFLSLKHWDATAGLVVPSRFDHRSECYAGLDLSATTDLTSLELVFPSTWTEVDEHGFEVDVEGLEVVSQFWLPEAGLAERIERDQVPYDRWAAEGFLTLTEGEVVDYGAVEAALVRAAASYDLRSVGHDRWQAGPVVQAVQGEGILAVPIGQTYAGMSAATKELERLVLQHRLRHGGHPVLRWNADAVEVMRDNNDNVRPVKPDRQKSTKRVDGITALVMALDRWLRRPVDAEAELQFR